ncbi:hypothetical protein BC629DRAFT_1529759, partial [Irpex lacteus]
THGIIIKLRGAKRLRACHVAPEGQDYRLRAHDELDFPFLRFFFVTTGFWIFWITHIIFPFDPAAIAALIAALIQAEQDILVLKVGGTLTCILQYELIWRSKLSRGSVLYFIMPRLDIMLSLIIPSIDYLWENPSFSYCKVWYYFEAWTGVACVIPITIILTFRTYAVCDRAASVKYLLWALILISNVGLIACVIVTTVQIEFAESAKIVPGYTCVMTATGFSRAAGIVQYASSTLFDFGIFFITAGRLYRLYVFGRTKLAKIILEDCVWYFMTLAWIAAFACLPPARATLSAVIANLARSISVIITSRIVLRLREFVANPEATVTVGTMTCPPVISSRFSESSSDGSTTVYTKGSTSKEWNPRGRGQAPILAKAVTEDVEMPAYSPYQRAF